MGDFLFVTGCVVFWSIVGFLFGLDAYLRTRPGKWPGVRTLAKAGLHYALPAAAGIFALGFLVYLLLFGQKGSFVKALVWAAFLGLLYYLRVSRTDN